MGGRRGDGLKRRDLPPADFGTAVHGSLTNASEKSNEGIGATLAARRNSVRRRLRKPHGRKRIRIAKERMRSAKDAEPAAPIQARGRTAGTGRAPFRSDGASRCEAIVCGAVGVDSAEEVVDAADAGDFSPFMAFFWLSHLRI